MTGKAQGVLLKAWGKSATVELAGERSGLKGTGEAGRGAPETLALNVAKMQPLPTAAAHHPCTE